MYEFIDLLTSDLVLFLGLILINIYNFLNSEFQK